jgi:glycosyltransferase involved in cell wall biosynthesis
LRLALPGLRHRISLKSGPVSFLIDADESNRYEAELPIRSQGAPIALPGQGPAGRQAPEAIAEERMQAATPLGFCTIVAKNYLAHARSLAQSLARHHPGVPFYVLLADQSDGYFEPTAEAFTIVALEELEIRDLPHFCFQYSVLELAKATKPYFLDYLFHRFECAKLVFVDPDVLIFAPLALLLAKLEAHSLVLTPHLTDFTAWDGKRWSELDVLRAGSFNLGLFGLANWESSRAFLDWWKDRLYSGCRRVLSHGMNLDQRWIDLAPGIWDEVSIERDPGYNVAHWNLHERKIRLEGERFLVNGRDLCSYHFSGYDPALPAQLASEQNRFEMNQIGDARRLYELYRQRLIDNGYLECRTWPYSYAAFDNGVPIPDLCRTIYVEMGPTADEFGDPFQTVGHSYYRYLIDSGQGGVPRLLEELYKRRADLRATFPDILGADRDAFLGWAHTFAEREFSIDPRMLSGDRTLCPTPESDRQRGKTIRLLTEGTLGVNLAGFFHSEKGVGEAARLVIRALEAGQIPFVLNNVQDSGSANQQLGGLVSTSPDNPFDISLIQLNADQMGHILGKRVHYLEGHYNIGYWNWELSDFPPEWQASFDYFDEVWVPSTFTQESVAAVSPIPVYCVPFAVVVPEFAPACISRRSFGLPEEAFLFLFSFDFHSWLERKNPLGVIEAFQLAFGNRTDVGLVLKSVHGLARRHDWARLRAACAGQTNIHVIDRVMDRETMYALMRLCDAYVSLHRAEGFGLGLAEMMAMGKPVIGTAYSAPLDFMNHKNSMLVCYRMAAIGQSHGPYRAGFSWAEPDMQHAALCMERLASNRQAAQEIGRRARADIERELNPRRIGQLIYSRLLATTGRGPEGKRLLRHAGASPAKLAA